MLSSTVLEVAIGLVFCYASVAMIASSVYEGIASLFKLRATSLLKGVKALLNDQALTGLALDVYNHALVNPRHEGTTKPGEAPSVLPSYIEPKHFALALIDAIQEGQGTIEDLKRKIDGLPEGQLKQMLLGMYARADMKIEKLEAELADWFDGGMERVSGGYKRKAQLFTFLFALAIAVAFNIDSFHLFRTLWDHPALVAQIATPATQNASAAVTNLQVLPVGWQACSPSTPPEVVAFYCAPSFRGGFPTGVVAFFGWLVTASSALFGAPFWFDLLKRLINLRGTGQKPNDNEKKKEKETKTETEKQK